MSKSFFPCNEENMWTSIYLWFMFVNKKIAILNKHVEKFKRWDCK